MADCPWERELQMLPHYSRATLLQRRKVWLFRRGRTCCRTDQSRLEELLARTQELLGNAPPPPNGGGPPLCPLPLPPPPPPRPKKG